MDDLANALEDAQYYMAISQEGSSLASSSSYKFVDAEALVGVKVSGRQFHQKLPTPTPHHAPPPLALPLRPPSKRRAS